MPLKQLKVMAWRVAVVWHLKEFASVTLLILVGLIPFQSITLWKNFNSLPWLGTIKFHPNDRTH